MVVKKNLPIRKWLLFINVCLLNVSCDFYPPLRLWNIYPACWLWGKDPFLRNQVPEETSPHLLLGTQDQRLGAEQDQLPCRSTKTSSDGNLHGSGMSHATTASTKLSFRAPWRMGDAVVGRGNAWWTTSKSAHPCISQNCSQGPPAEENLCWIVPHVYPLPLPPATQSSRDWIELNLMSYWYRHSLFFSKRIFTLAFYLQWPPLLLCLIRTWPKEKLQVSLTP